jgi:hypothetical protein
MTIMHILVVELLHQTAMGGFQYSNTYCQVHVGVCGHILSCQASNVIIF